MRETAGDNRALDVQTVSGFNEVRGGGGGSVAAGARLVSVRGRGGTRGRAETRRAPGGAVI